jgi:hypothetical protein
MISKYKTFYDSIERYDGFSDVEVSLSFWDCDINRVEINDFSKKCIPAITRKPITVCIDSDESLDDILKMLISGYSDLNSEEYPNIDISGFEYTSNMAGFVACHMSNNFYSIVPIVEFFGRDAEIIISTITLLS